LNLNSSHSRRESPYFNPRAETESRAIIEETQSKLFRQTVQNACENSLFYKEYFKRLGIKAEDIDSIKNLQSRKFFTTKEDLRTNYPYGMLAISRTKVAEMHATSGTTGTPTLGLHSQRDLDDWAEIAARSLVMSGLTKEDVFQITPSLGMFSGGFGFYHGCRKVGATIVPASAGFSKRQIQYMIDFGTTMFCAIVSYAFRLAEVASETGIDLKKDTKVRKGVFGSEIWTREMKGRLSNIWDMDPYDIYGFTELYGPGVGNDCVVHDGLHIWEDFFLVEVIDPETLDPVGPEEEGELVFTTLRKEAMPLLRYRSRDISSLIDSTTCECGRTHRRYKEIKARSDDMIKISGVNFWPSEIETLLLKEENVDPEYRIKISKAGFLDRVTIEIESREKILDQSKKEVLSKKLAKDLRDGLLFSPEVIIIDPNTLPRVEVGKTKRVLDER
jgi:phenylacetate-CoA ligase